MNKRLITLLLAISLIFTLPGMSGLLYLNVWADEIEENEDQEEKASDVEIEKIVLSTVEDFVKFAQEARTQEYSSGKIISLETDIDLAAYPNLTVPYLDGYFDGNSHVIKNAVLEENMSDYALFRYIGENGQLRNVTIEAKVYASDEQQNIGIIAGINNGNILNCTAQGSLEGKAQSGGICGLNEETGIINNCVNEAEINGKYQTGGIAGANKGIINSCTNDGKINANAKILKNSMDGDSSSVNISISNAVTGLAADERANETGGIAGYSEGEINNSTNRAVIGCQHLGGATGGIVGHLNGNVRNCSNTKVVYGHKQIGGIVGYFEAADAFSYNVDYVQQLKDQLDELSDSIDDLSDAGEALGDNFSANADVLSTEIKNLRSSLQSYGDGFSYDLDASRESIRNQANTIIEIADDMDYDFKTRQIQKSVRKLKEDTDKIVELIVELRTLTVNLTAEDYATLASLMEALKHFEKTSAEYQRLYQQIIAILGGASKSHSMKNSDDSLLGKADSEEIIILSDEEAVTTGQEQESTENEGNVDAPAVDSEKPEEEVISPENNPENEDSNVEENQSAEDILDNSDNTNAENSAEENVESNVDSAGDTVAMVNHIEKTFEMFAAPNEVMALSGNSADNMTRVMQIMDELTKYEKDAKTQADTIMKYMDRMPGEFEDVEDDLKDLRDNFENVYDLSYDLIVKLDNRADIMRADVRSQGDVISSSIDYTRASLDADFERFNRSLDRLSDRAHDLRMTVSDGYDEIRERIKDRNIYIDVSELSEIKNGNGRVLSCNNSGEVIADSLAGGIVGAIDKADSSDISLGIINEFIGGVDIDDEDEKDDNPEDDKDSVAKHIEAVIYDCKNTADVSSKGDCAGGVVGKAKYGYIKDCQNYGDVVAKEGKYIGGIAGLSKLAIDGSYMLGGLDGMSFVGGISGKGNDITNSYSCAYMDMDEEYSKSAGAIAGKISGTAQNNYFVDNGFGAINGVTKTTEATGMSYREMLSFSTMPTEYKRFNIRFADNDEIVWSNVFNYGDELTEEEYPELIANDGEYAYWEEKNLTPICRNVTVHAIRRVFVPSIQAKVEESENKKPDLLLGGKFYPDTVINVRYANSDETDKINAKKAEIKPDIHYVIAKNYSYEISQEEEFDANVCLRVLKDGIIPVNTLLILDEKFNPVTDVLAVDSVESFLTLDTAIPQKGYVVVIEKVSKSTVVFGTIVVVILLAILVVFVIFLIRKHRKLRKKIIQALEDTKKPIEELQGEQNNDQ